MRIILSPAKKMNVANDSISHSGLPVFIRETETILDWMKKQSYTDVKKLWNCNDQIAELNFKRYAKMDLYRNLTPAILSYEGIAFQYMAPSVFEDSQFWYIQRHLRILSGFYGVLKPMDGVVPYRLEMQAKARIMGKKDLYEFWGDRIYREVTGDVKAGKAAVIINLASKEYSKCIEKYLQPDDVYITCIFGELEKGKIVQKGVYAKMARGEMVRFMAEKQIEDPAEIRKFDRLGYQFADSVSTETEYVFLKNK